MKARTVVCVAGLSGAATMSVELSAVRLLSPWYGASTAVWTNVIAVVLLGLSAGYALGARLSTRSDPLRSLAIALVVAALPIAWSPAFAHPVGRWFLPEGTTLGEAGQLVAWGSLASACVLFLVPAVLLGCVAPLATETIARTPGIGAGRAGGRVLAASTLGSLAGTFATPYWLVPSVGLDATYLGTAALLFAMGAAILWSERRASAAAVSVLLLAPAFFVSRVAAAPISEGESLLEAVESQYQSIRVVDASADGLRYLKVNESFDSFQSVWSREPGFLPDGFYYNAFAYPAWWNRRAGDWRVGIVGLGAGTAWRVLDGAMPAGMRAVGDGAEIDPEIVRVARAWLGLPKEGGERRTWSGVDGRVALRAWPEGCDQIVVDAYANQTEIPPHLASREFCELALSKLRPGGWISLNVGAFGLDDPVLVAVAETLASACGERVLALSIPFSRNVAVIGRRGALPPEPRTEGWRTGDASVDRQLARFEVPGTWRWLEPARVPIDDDRNPIEDLQRRSILRAGGDEP